MPRRHIACHVDAKGHLSVLSTRRFLTPGLSFIIFFLLLFYQLSRLVCVRNYRMDAHLVLDKTLIVGNVNNAIGDQTISGTSGRYFAFLLKRTTL